MESDVRHLIRSFFSEPAESSCDACWRPSVDVYRGDNGWLVKFDLAGVRPEDVQLTVEGRRLIARGRRRDWVIAEGHRAYSMEISYNQFERSVELPCPLDQMEIRSEYRDGMFLVVILPPQEQS